MNHRQLENMCGVIPIKGLVSKYVIDSYNSIIRNKVDNRYFTNEDILCNIIIYQ